MKHKRLFVLALLMAVISISSFFIYDNTYKEELKLAGLMTGKYYLDINNTNVDFYIVKGIVEELLDYLGYAGRYTINVGEVPNELHPGMSAVINMQGKNIGVIGRLHPNVTNDDVYVFEINLDKLPSSGKKLFIEKKFSGCSKDKSNGSIFFIASPFKYFFCFTQNHIETYDFGETTFFFRICSLLTFPKRSGNRSLNVFLASLSMQNSLYHNTSNY